MLESRSQYRIRRYHRCIAFVDSECLHPPSETPIGRVREALTIVAMRQLLSERKIQQRKEERCIPGEDIGTQSTSDNVAWGRLAREQRAAQYNTNRDGVRYCSMGERT